MTLIEYMEWTRTTAIYPGACEGEMAELQYLTLGLASEAGEVAGVVKKLQRDGWTPAVVDNLPAELGDVLWYWVRLCDACGVDPEAVMRANRIKLVSRQSRGALGGSGDER